MIHVQPLGVGSMCYSYTNLYTSLTKYRAKSFILAWEKCIFTRSGLRTRDVPYTTVSGVDDFSDICNTEKLRAMIVFGLGVP